MDGRWKLTGRDDREVGVKIAALLEKKAAEQKPGQKLTPGVVAVRPETSLATAAHRMRLERIGCVLISADGKHLDGIVAVRDIVYALAEHEPEIRERSGGDVMDAPVSRVMTKVVKTCNPGDTLKDVMEMMTHHHILHVPVMEKGEVIGIVSIDDVVKYGVEEMNLEKAVLQDTVTRLSTLRQD